MKRIIAVIVSIGLMYSCGTSKGKPEQEPVKDQVGAVSGNNGVIIENSNKIPNFAFRPIFSNKV